MARSTGLAPLMRRAGTARAISPWSKEIVRARRGVMTFASTPAMGASVLAMWAR